MKAAYKILLRKLNTLRDIKEAKTITLGLFVDGKCRRYRISKEKAIDYTLSGLVVVCHMTGDKLIIYAQSAI